MAYTSDSDDKALLSRVDDAIFLSEKRGSPCFLNFLNEREQSFVTSYLSRRKVIFDFYGGYKKAVRKILCISPYECSEEEYPVKAVYFKYRSSDSLSHRDILGSVMSLGLERDTVGDILIGSGCAAVFLKEDIAEYVKSQIYKIGRVGIIIADKNSCDIDYEPKTEELSVVVASMRLDVIVSAAAGLSREKSSALISSGNVFTDYLENKNVSYNLKLGEVFSIRGKGKFIVKEQCGITKKGRIKLTLIHYI